MFATFDAREVRIRQKAEGNRPRISKAIKPEVIGLMRQKAYLETFRYDKKREEAVFANENRLFPFYLFYCAAFFFSCSARTRSGIGFS